MQEERSQNNIINTIFFSINKHTWILVFKQKWCYSCICAKPVILRSFFKDVLRANFRLKKTNNLEEKSLKLFKFSGSRGLGLWSFTKVNQWRCETFKKPLKSTLRINCGGYWAKDISGVFKLSAFLPLRIKCRHFEVCHLLKACIVYTGSPPHTLWKCSQISLCLARLFWRKTSI